MPNRSFLFFEFFNFWCPKRKKPQNIHTKRRCENEEISNQTHILVTFSANFINEQPEKYEGGEVAPLQQTGATSKL